jgi:aminopeptidase YwaD
MKKYMISSFMMFMVLALFGQDCYPVDNDQVKRIQQDVKFLSDDRLEGRAPGTKGIAAARDFIAKRFEKEGIIPVGEGGTYFQEFTVPEPVLVDAKKTYIVVTDTLFADKSNYTVLQAENGTVSGKPVWVGYGISAPEMDYDDYKKIKSLKGKIAVMDVSAPDGVHPHSKYVKYHDLSNRIALAKGKGAAGVALVNLGDMANDPMSKYRTIRSSGIPVFFVGDDEVAKKLKKAKTLTISVSQKEEEADAYNVVGYIDNGKPTTVIIGAHYDHLGWGGEGSRAPGVHAIHNGADDNASGTAALIALAEFLGNKDDLTGHNYLFIAFSAEERGLLGSKFYVENPTHVIDNAAYMINMDMVGRLREGALQISGTGTAAQWAEAIASSQCEGLSFKLDPSGIGPSDHTSFYTIGIPVLHFFTGSHDDYHKPEDDADKINYKGIGTIVSLIKTVMRQVDEVEKLDYQETKNSEARKAPRFSVTLGILPDYLYEDGGVKVDGVTEGKPAKAAGLQKGDIIMELGDFTIADIYAYMNALAAFKKGDEVKVVYMREGKKMEGKVKF